MTQKPWFSGDLGENFHRRQQAENILPRIALTAKEPTHPDALQFCCHAYTAAFIAKNIESGALEDTDEIVFVGTGDLVFHSFVIREDEVVGDRSLSKGKCEVDLENGTYHSESYRATNPNLHDDIKILRRMSIGEFRQTYYDNVNVKMKPSNTDVEDAEPPPA